MNDSISIAKPHAQQDVIQKVGLGLTGLGLIILLITWAGVTLSASIYLWLALVFLFVGVTVYAHRTYSQVPAGIKNNRIYFDSLTNRGALGWLAGIVFTAFYIFLYFYPEFLGLSKEGNTGMVALFDPLSQFFKGQPASQWFVYGTLYTLVILTLGIKFIYKYRHNQYQILRTVSVTIAQLFFAYLIPEIMEGLSSGEPYYGKDLKNMWPLNYYFFDSWHIKNMQASPTGMVFLVWGIALFAIITPIVTYFVGKRWYCSWICGCGGLAETAGDPFRHLSDKSTDAWALERVLIHAVLVFVVIMTAMVLTTHFTRHSFGIAMNRWFAVLLTGLIVGGILLWQNLKFRKKKIPTRKLHAVGAVVFVFFALYILWGHLFQGASSTINFSTYEVKSWYSFFIGATFSGVVGVGFYPILGNRVWCRFGCPLAGYMGLIQRFKSRFRITTNGGQCISCGNCSTYCEQGIDVRWYAQRGQNIVRSSCVGCGICSAVCPRGVLKLENGPEEGRING